MNLSTAPVSKGDFAVMLSVSPGRISQYITEGKIFGPALVGEGRRAKINPDVAKAQLRKTLEPSQRFGANGTALNRVERPTDPEPGLFSSGSSEVARSQAAAPPLAPQAPPVDEFAELRLRRERLKTEQAEREERLQTGRYMLAEDGRREVAKAVGAAFGVMDQGLQQMSEMLSEQFSLPQRDVLHALVKSFRVVRAAAAEDFRRQAGEEGEHVEDPDQ